MSKQTELVGLARTTNLDEVNAAYSAGALSNRNMIINGSHIVNQRGIVSVTTPSDQQVVTSDGWRSYALGQPSNITIQEATLPDGTVVNTHKTTTTTTGGWMHPFQKVETFGKSYLRGKLVTISLWVKTNVAGQRIRICDTVTCYELGDEIPSDGAWHYVTASHTMTTNMATGNSSFLQIHPAFGFDATTVEGSYVEFTLVQLEVGPATPFEHRSFAQELALCQRYYENHTDWIHWATYTPAAMTVNPIINYAVKKRAAPSVTISEVSGTLGVQLIGGGPSGFDFRNSNGYVTGSADKYFTWTADAEL